MKANNHPLVRELRAILDKHGLKCAVLLAIADDGQSTMTISAGKTKKICDLVGPVVGSNIAETLLIWLERPMP